jgi:hypothetical protein
MHEAIIREGIPADLGDSYLYLFVNAGVRELNVKP